MKTVSVKVASAVVAALGLTTGVVGAVSAQTMGSIDGSGDDSHNGVNVLSNDQTRNHKNADVNVENNNPQHATTGDSSVTDGDDDGAATSGDAKNGSKLNGGVTVTQSTAAAANSSSSAGDTSGTIGTTGEDSHNHVNVLSNVQTSNRATANVNVENNNSQTATSGKATVKGGDDGGKATSGAASNTSDTSFTVTVTQ